MESSIRIAYVSLYLSHYYKEIIGKELEILYNVNYEPNKNPRVINKTPAIKTDFSEVNENLLTEITP